MNHKLNEFFPKLIFKLFSLSMKIFVKINIVSSSKINKDIVLCNRFINKQFSHKKLFNKGLSLFLFSLNELIKWLSILILS